MSENQFNELKSEIIKTNQNVDGLTETVNGLTKDVDKLTKTVNGLTKVVNEIAKNVNALTKEMDKRFEEQEDRINKRFKEQEDKMNKRFEELDNKIDETRLELIKQMNSVEYNIRLEIKDFREINSREHDIMKNDIQVGRRERKEIQDALFGLLELSKANDQKHKEYDRILNLQ